MGLLICTITDLKYKEIYFPVIIAELVLLSGFNIWQNRFVPADIAGAVIVCVLFILSGFISRGQIGTGDAFLFAVTGTGLGLMANIFIIMVTFIFAFCVAVFLVVVKHKPGSYSMPLAPFVLSSFVFYVAWVYL